MSARLSHYDTLGVNRDAARKDINAAYKKLALSLHPDKNAFGAQLMKQVNEAKDVLLDEEKRRKYDEELNHSSSSSESTSSSETSSLQRRLRESQHKQSMLKMEISNLQAQLAVARASSPMRGDYHQLNRLQSQLQNSEGECRWLKSRLQSLESNYFNLSYDLDDAGRENEQLRRENKYLENAVKEERRRSSDELAVALKAERENVRKSLTERSLCYRCNGEGGDDCMLCHGYGLLHGQWTKCHKCSGTGSFLSIGGREENCYSCFNLGAREGAHTITCFKCEGSGIKCNVCYKGKIRGFNLKKCPFCQGRGCENCTEKGFVSCQCGFSCSGH